MGQGQEASTPLQFSDMLIRAFRESILTGDRMPFLNGGSFQRVPTDKVDMDTENPRIARFLDMYPDKSKITPEQIFLALGAEAPQDESSGGPTYTKLRESIKTCGTIIQPIVVRRKQDGSLVCLDGNTRLALYKDFKKKKVNGTWDRIPALVYDGLGDQEMDAVRLQAHLVGPRPWDPYSKAKYLNELRNTKRFPFSELVDYCGGSTKTVQELIDAYNDMEEHYRPALEEDQAFDVRKFSAFAELQKPGVKAAIQGAGFTLSDFAHWIINQNIPKNADVRMLPRILKHPRAKPVFLKSNVPTAERELDHPDLDKALSEASLADLCRAVRQLYDQIHHSEVKRLANDPSLPDVEAINDAHDALAELLKDMEREKED